MLITDIKFAMVEMEITQHKKWTQTTYTCTSLLKDQLIFAISYDLLYLERAALVGFGNSAYATTVGKVIVNPLLDDTFGLRFNESFVFNGETIPPHTDILAIDAIKKHIKIEHSSFQSCHGNNDKIITFDDYFMSASDFPAEAYMAVFTCKTSEGTTFERSTNFRTS